MLNAINEAKKSLKISDIPIGCVIYKNGEIIASAHNMRIENCDVTAHAEMIAIKQAQEVLKTSRLIDCEMFVTLEPCPMCAWAIIQSGIRAIYFGSYNLQYGAMGSVTDLPKIANSKIKIYGGIEEEKCTKMLNDFFAKIRKER